VTRCLKCCIYAKRNFKKLTSLVPVLLDFTDSYADQTFMNELKRLGMEYDSLILDQALQIKN